MVKYTLLVENKAHRFGNGLCSLKNGPVFMLFIIGVTIGITFALMCTQYQSMVANRSHQLHLDRLSMLVDEEIAHLHSTRPLNDNSTKHSQSMEDIHLHENVTLATKLFKEVRILCFILTTPKNHRTRAIHIKRTWGKRCNKLLFMSSRQDKSLDAIPLNVSADNPAMTWGKTKAAFQYIYKHHRDDADWFLKTDDDTYVILENLRYFLYTYSTNDPIHFGYKINQPDALKHGYFSGGAGYVLSKNALHRFSEAMSLPAGDIRNCAFDSDKGVENLEIGKCMEALGVVAGDTRDETKRERFFPNTPEAHLIPGQINPDDAYWKHKWYRSLEGLDCCSDNAISFHRIRPEQMYSFDYLIYHLRPYGIVSFSQPLPKKANFSEIASQLLKEQPESLLSHSNLPNY